MRYNISHKLKYRYSMPAFLEPLTIRLRPRYDSLQHVLEFKLEVSPSPAGISEHIDKECNNAAGLWFNGQHETLQISAVSQVDVHEANQFNFIITENSLLKLPGDYPSAYKYYLQPYIDRRYSISKIDDFIKHVLDEAKGETVAFLTGLSSTIFDRFRKVVRDDGDPMPPEETLSKGNGACRDLAVLFIESCRAVGLAARFVSGYKWSETASENRNMHAWAEVYLPGGGWRGFDPGTGLAVNDCYVAVAAAAEPGNAAAVSGKFRGTGVNCNLEFDVSINLSK